MELFTLESAKLPQLPRGGSLARACGAANEEHLTNYRTTMAAPASEYKDRQFLAVIGDEVRYFSLVEESIQNSGH